MISLTEKQVKNNLKKALNKNSQTNEPILITRKRRKKIIMLTQKAYDNIIENLYLRQSKRNYEHILKGIEEAKNI